MFFPEKIKSINEYDRVLEIGPGGNPHSRSDVFLELIIEDEEKRKRQNGGVESAVTDKPIVYYDGKKFPFKDKEFDYVICSHVIEHIDDVENFLKEMFRVSRKGYMEYPVIYYEYLYDIPEHINFVKYDSGRLLYLRKELTNFSEFNCVQSFFFESLNKGYTDIVDDLKKFMFEGFEWFDKFEIENVSDIKSLCWSNYKIENKKIL